MGGFLLASGLTGCGGSSSSSSSTSSGGATTTTMSLLGSTSGLSGSSVSVSIGGSVVATGTADSAGNYSVSVPVISTSEEQNMTVTATNGNVVMTSLVGNAGTVLANRNSSNEVSGTNYPRANINSVSTSVVAAIREQNGGALPNTEAEINSVITDIIVDTGSLLNNITTVAASVQSVLNYGAEPASLGTPAGSSTAIVNTDQMVRHMATLASPVADATTVVNSATIGTPTLAELETEVTTDPDNASATLSSFAGILTGLSGKYYMFNDTNGEGSTVIYFDSASTYLLADQNNLLAGTTSSGTYTIDTTTGVLTVPLAETITWTITGGNSNAFTANLYDTNPVYAAGNGPVVVRRIEPIGVAGGVPLTALQGNIYTNVVDNESVKLASVCDGVTADGWMAKDIGKLTGAKCNAFMGMLIVIPPTNAFSVTTAFVGLAPGNWDGSVLTQSLSGMHWDSADTLAKTPNGVLYSPLDTGNPHNNPIRLRIRQSDNRAELRFITSTNGAVANQAVQEFYWQLPDDTNGSGQRTIEYGGAVAGYPGITSASYTAGTSTAHGSLVNTIYLGNSGGVKRTAGFKDNALGELATKVNYDLQPITNAMVSGKSFSNEVLSNGVSFATLNVTYNANGTFTENGTINGTAVTRTGTWSIGPAYSPAEFGYGTTYPNTLITSYTGDTGWYHYTYSELGSTATAGDTGFWANFVVSDTGAFDWVNYGTMTVQ